MSLANITWTLYQIAHSTLKCVQHHRGFNTKCVVHSPCFHKNTLKAKQLHALPHAFTMLENRRV